MRKVYLKEYCSAIKCEFHHYNSQCGLCSIYGTRKVADYFIFKVNPNDQTVGRFQEKCPHKRLIQLLYKLERV